MALNVLAIIQARMDSTRLPGKVLKEVNGKPLIEILLHRLSQSNKIAKIILATSQSKENNLLVETVEKLGFDVFRGNENDVLDRYYHAAKEYQPTTVVRITGDCPIIDPQLVDAVIELYQQNTADYASNTEPPTFPDGLDTEVFSFAALKACYEQAEKLFEREHVTPFIRTNARFQRVNCANETDLSGERWTVDNSEDFEVISNIIKNYSPNLNFSCSDVLELKKSHPEYFEANKQIARNEGAKMGTGQKLWQRAKNYSRR
jgi:glutamate-1-semialdehyde 2,1-aminomutase